MAFFAKSKVDRFPGDSRGSGLGPGDYDPCVPKPSEYNKGAVSLGFTAGKRFSQSPSKDGSTVTAQEVIVSPPSERKLSPPPRSSRPSSASGPPYLTPPKTRIPNIGTEVQTKQADLNGRSRMQQKIQVEAVKLREREVRHRLRLKENQKTLAKTQHQARSDAAKALTAREALLKQAGSAERKLRHKDTEKKRMETFETKAARLQQDYEAAEASEREAREAMMKSETSAAEAMRRAENLVERVGRLEEELDAHRAAASEDGPAAEWSARDAEKVKLLGEGETKVIELQLALASAESKLESCGTEREVLHSALREQSASCETLRQELAVSRDRRSAEDAEIVRLRAEIDHLKSQLGSAKVNAERLESALAETSRNAAGLQERLADALSEGVEYADAAIRSEESLRNSEADCAALWEEREDAKQQLAAAYVQGRALEEKLEDSLAERRRLEVALKQAEARLESLSRESDDVEDELAASREENIHVRKELEMSTGRLATLASETRVLKGCLDESRTSSEKMKQELDVANATLAAAASEVKSMKVQLGKHQDRVAKLTAELKDALTQVDGGAADYVAMKQRLADSESSRERLKHALSAAEAKLENAAADDSRGTAEFLETLAKCTNLQEMLGDAEEQLRDLRDEYVEMGRRVADSESRRGQLAKALAEAQADRKSAVVTVERLEMQLSESTSACTELQDALGKTQRRLDQVVAEKGALETRLRETRARSSRASDTLRDTTSQLAAEVAAGAATKKDLATSEAECEVMLSEIAEVHSRLASASREFQGVGDELARSEAERRAVQARLERVEAEKMQLCEQMSALESGAEACRASLAEFLEERGAIDARTIQLEAHLRESDGLCSELRDMLQLATDAMNTASSTVKTLEERLYHSGSAPTQGGGGERESSRKSGEVRGTTGASPAAAAAAAAKFAQSKSSGSISRILDEIGESMNRSDRTQLDTQRRKFLSDMEGLGKELGDRLAAVIEERNAALCRLELAQGSLAASSAAARSMERGLANSEAREKAMINELEDCRQELEDARNEYQRLEDAIETRVHGASAMLAKREAETEELSARLQLKEAESSRELALAKKEADCARAELDVMSAELKELRAIASGMTMRRRSGSGRVREGSNASSTMVGQQASENTAQVGNSGSPKANKSGNNGPFEDLRRENVKLMRETTSLSSELALATAVLEVVGILPKEDSQSTRREQPKDDVGIKIGSTRRGLMPNSRGERGSNSVSPGRTMNRRGLDLSRGRSSSERKRSLRRWSRSTPRENSLSGTQAQDDDLRDIYRGSGSTRLALEDRLLSALGSTSLTASTNSSTNVSSTASQNSSPEGSKQIQWNSAKVRVRSAASKAGCFVLKCGGIDRSSNDLASTPSTVRSSGSGSCVQLTDERIRTEVRKILAAQASTRLTNSGVRYE